jgi:MFS family permease
MWLAVKTSGSNAGFVAAAQGIAVILFGMLGGVFADRWNRRVSMILVDIIRALVVLVLPVLALNGLLQFWHLAVVSFIIGAVGSLFDPALQASLPALTGGDEGTLQATNGLMDITQRLARLIGPSLAALLVVFMPLAHLFTLDAVSFAVSALVLLALGSKYAWKPEQTTDRKKGPHGILQEAGEGVQVVAGNSGIRAAISSNIVGNFVWGISFVVGVPLLASRVMGHTIGVYGLIIGAYGVGNVIGNLIIGSMHIRRRVLSIYLGRIVLGGGFTLLAFAPNVPLALLASFLAAFGGPMGDIMTTMMIQELPENQRGKAYGLMSMMGYAGYALGLLVAVPLFALVSIPLGIATGGVFCLVTSLLGLLGSAVRLEKTQLLTVREGGVAVES